MTKRYASIVLDKDIGKPLDYLIPDQFLEIIKRGMRVEVPVKNSLDKGYVIDLKESPSVEKTHVISRILSEEVISKELFDLALWMSKYYCTTITRVLKCIVPPSIRQEVHPKTKLFLSLAKSKKETLNLLSTLKTTPAQAKVLELLLHAQKGLFLKDLLKEADISRAPIDLLIKKKIIHCEEILSDSNNILLQKDFFMTTPKKLTNEQEQAFSKISASLESGKFEAHLLFGITGSGKTEIYLQAIQKALDLKKNGIMLVPEISLTPQTIERFKGRFKNKIAILHHKRSLGERFEAWHSALKEEANIVIGARSAIFTPIPNLGLIIVDEEHDNSYKQSEESPAYHARNIALIRGKLERCTVILGSATPSLESYFRAEKDNLILSHLASRPNAKLPKVHIIDMKKEREKNGAFSHFSEPLLEGIKERFKRGEQTLLFLNRRGYNAFLFCKNCSKVFKCPHCDIALAFHKNAGLLLCHLCGYKTPPFHTCPNCKSEEPIKYSGFGTEHVEKSLKAMLPEIRTLRLDRDTTSGKHSHETLLKEFKSGKADVLIGTQMIVKGLHFPSVTLVGVLNTDSALNIPDFRSSENVFQLLTQVAGRAGRSLLEGEVIIQTNFPEHPIINWAAKQDFLSFYQNELENRKLFDYPPFSHLAKFLFSGPDEKTLLASSTAFRELLIKNLSPSFEIYPIIPAGHEKIKDLFRLQFLIKGQTMQNLHLAIAKLRNQYKLPSSIKLFIDIDPASTFF